MRISARLKLAALAPMFMALVIGLALLLSYRESREAEAKGRAAQRIIASTNELADVARAYMLHAEQRPKQQFIAEYDATQRLISTARIDGTEQRQVLSRIQRNVESMRGTFQKLVANRERRDSTRNAALITEADERLAGNLLVVARDVWSDALRLEKLIDADITRTHGWTNALVFLLIIATTIPITIALLVVMRTINSSLARLREGTEAVAAGDLESRIGLTSKDEMGDVSRAFDAMTERLGETTVSRDALLEEVQQRKQAEDELQTALAELDVRAEELASINEELQVSNEEAAATNEELRLANDEIRREIDQRTEAEQALRESNSRLGLLSDTASRLLLTDDPQGMVQSLCERAMLTLDCDVFFNFLVDKQEGRLHLNACGGIPQEVCTSIEWLDYGAGVCGCVAHEGCRIVAEDIFNTPDPRTELVKGFGIQAYACHPLLAGRGRVIGTLSFGSRSKVAFTEDELGVMKAVADQVATAMERMRLLAESRQRAAELAQSEAQLRTTLDNLDEGVVASDLSGDIIHWNRAALEMHDYASMEEALRKLPEFADTFELKDADGRVLPVEEWPLSRVLRGEQVHSVEIQVRHLALGWRKVFSYSATLVHDAVGESILAIVNMRDITERKAAEKRERGIEAHQRDFYRRTILAATEGKLELAEPERVGALSGEVMRRWTFTTSEEHSIARQEAIELAESLGFAGDQLHRFMACAGEALSNAMKHGGGGEAAFHKTREGLILKVSDHGPGIDSAHFPSVALVKGFSTAGTLGMGYKLILACADKVYLSTGPDGTTVALEFALDGKAVVPVA